MQELIGLAKGSPGALNFASSGHGAAAHLAGELFKTEAKINIVHVAYKGAAPLISDKGVLDDGRKITVELTRQLMAEELEKIKAGYGVETFAKRDFARAAELFDTLTASAEFTEFLTLPGYRYLD